MRGNAQPCRCSHATTNTTFSDHPSVASYILWPVGVSQPATIPATIPLEPQSGDNKTGEPVTTTAGNEQPGRWCCRRSGDSYRWWSHPKIAPKAARCTPHGPPRCDAKVALYPGGPSRQSSGEGQSRERRGQRHVHRMAAIAGLACYETLRCSPRTGGVSTSADIPISTPWRRLHVDPSPVWFCPCLACFAGGRGDAAEWRRAPTRRLGLFVQDQSM